MRHSAGSGVFFLSRTLSLAKGGIDIAIHGLAIRERSSDRKRRIHTGPNYGLSLRDLITASSWSRLGLKEAGSAAETSFSNRFVISFL